MEQNKPSLLSVDSRRVRNIGGCIGISLDVCALRELGLVDKDGELKDGDIDARQKIRSDGTIEIVLPTD